MAKFKKPEATKTAVAESETFAEEDVGAVPAEVTSEAPKSETPKSDAPAGDKPAIPRTRGPRGTSESDKITITVAMNPKRPGSKAHTAFACYKNDMTIAEFCEAVDKLGDEHKATATGHLVYDTKHGFITIAGYTVPDGIISAKPRAEPKAKAEKKAKAPKTENTDPQTAAQTEETRVAQAEAVQAATAEESME